jgi:hypothetical protein
MANESFCYTSEDIDLVRKAADALHRAASNTTAYQQAIHDFRLVETVLRGVQHVSLTNTSDGTLSNLQHCDHFCRPPLDRFLHTLKALEPDLDQAFPETCAVSAHSAPILATRLAEEVKILQKNIGRGLRVIDALLCVENLRCDVGISGQLPAQMQQIIVSLQERLSSPSEDRAGRGHYYHNIQTSGSAYSHIGDKYFMNVAPAAPADDLSKRLDATASTYQAEQLISLVQDIKVMLPRASGFIEEGGTPAAHKSVDPSSQLSVSRSALPFDNEQAGLFLRCLLEMLGTSLNAILLMLMWTVPAMRYSKRVLASIPHPPSGLLESNIIFVDALNREFPLQYQQFRHWSVVSAWLQCQFQDCPGSLRVAHKRFAVFKDMKSTGRGVMIPFEEWEQMITPGQRVLMSMYVGQHNLAQGHWPLHNACPSCGFVDPNPHKTSVWTKW